MYFIRRKQCQYINRGKQILVEATAEKGKFRVSVRKRASVTEPEAYIRKKRKLREVINGAANYS